MKFPVSNPAADIGQKIGFSVGIIKDNNALYFETSCQYGPHYAGKSIRFVGARGFVVVRNHAAHCHARADIQAVEDRIKHGSSHVLKIYIDPIRTNFGQLGLQVGRKVTNAGVVTQFVHCVAAFFLRASNTDHSTSRDSGNLSDHTTHGPRCGRYDYGIACLGLADVQ